jgi:Zn2+/Cd2+-exporting ATPase
MAAHGGEQTFHITGIDCASCAHSLEVALGQIDGVQSCTLNATTATLRVVGDVPADAITERVRALGYDVAAPQDWAAPQPAHSSSFLAFLWQRRTTRLALVGLVLILPCIILGDIMGLHHPLLTVAALGALVTAGIPIARSGIRTLWISRQMSINLLMTIASIGAVIIGAYTEAGMVMVLFAIGEALEGYTTDRARNAIRSLMAVMPNHALLLRRADGEPAGGCDEGGCGCTDTACASGQLVAVETLQVGDVLLVKPGERIPMDGRIVAGSSSVNQAPITGESRLIEKDSGSEVFASSINGEGTLEVEVTRLAADTTMSRIIQMVEEAQEKRAPMQRFIDRFAHGYTPAVIALALLLATVPPLFLGQPFWNPDASTHGWLYRALATLVVACPCALVISTPVSIISAISNAARHGVLVKGGVYLETLSRVNAIAFDKTGTLTEGKPSVIRVRSTACTLPPHIAAHAAAAHAAQWCDPCNDMLALASAIEQRSEHPLAQAIVNESVRCGVQHRYPAAESVHALVGQGVMGYVQGKPITIGSHRYFDQAFPHAPHYCEEARQDAEQGYTPVMVGNDHTYLGTITLSDTVRSHSQHAIARLKQMGLAALVMVTGDTAQTARAIGQQVGIADIRAELLPAEKVATVEALRREYGTVAMVGDGINDTPALATADVGIAVGGASGGTDQAMETADITLMRDDLSQLPFALRLSRTTMQTIRTNIILSLAIKLGFLLLVVMGVGTMWMAVIADMGTSLLVTANGMRLLRQPGQEENP